VNKVLARHIVPQVIEFRADGMKLEGLGKGDGTWVIPTDYIHRDSICYCVGVGVDVSFDIELARRGARVFCFDPTPRSIEYMNSLEYDHERIKFMPIGIWRKNEKLKFYAPMNLEHANFSTRNIHGTSEYFIADCRRLTDVMKQLGHDHIDLLKLDIEGSWYEVLQDVIESKIPIKILCVEFDTPTSLVKSMRMINMLRQSGFLPVHKHRDNFLFVNKS
jgi:FkbM family methyltransferase